MARDVEINTYELKNLPGSLDHDNIMLSISRIIVSSIILMLVVTTSNLVSLFRLFVDSTVIAPFLLCSPHILKIFQFLFLFEDGNEGRIHEILMVFFFYDSTKIPMMTRLVLR